MARYFRIKGTDKVVSAGCLKEAIKKLVHPTDFTYRPHWYTRVNRLSWADVQTPNGFKCIVEEVAKGEGFGRDGGEIAWVERFVSAGGRRYYYEVYYAPTGTKRDANECYGRRVHYTEQDTLPNTVVRFLTGDDVRCETTYTNTGKVEVTTKKDASNWLTNLKNQRR